MECQSCNRKRIFKIPHLQNLVDGPLPVVCDKRRTTSKHVEHQCAQTPPVDRFAMTATHQNLRRHIFWQKMVLFRKTLFSLGIIVENYIFGMFLSPIFNCLFFFTIRGFSNQLFHRRCAFSGHPRWPPCRARNRSVSRGRAHPAECSRASDHDRLFLEIDFL